MCLAVQEGVVDTWTRTGMRSLWEGRALGGIIMLGPVDGWGRRMRERGFCRLFIRALALGEIGVIGVVGGGILGLAREVCEVHEAIGRARCYQGINNQR